jgi:hypothetical protein
MKTMNANGLAGQPWRTPLLKFTHGEVPDLVRTEIRADWYKA